MIEILIVIVSLGGIASIIEAVADYKSREEEREHREILENLISPYRSNKKGKR